VSKRFDSVVVGGGLVGLLTARALAGAGLSVCLLERAALCRESSWAGGGIISPLVPWEYPAAVAELVHWSQQVYPELTAELHALTGIDPQWVRSGLLLEGMTLSDAARNWATRYQMAVAELDAASVLRMEPALEHPAAAALYLPDVAQVRNPRLCQALGQALRKEGVDIREQCAVSRVEVQQGRVTGVTTADGGVHGANVVIAGGAWSGQLLPAVCAAVPVRPVRGQMIQFQARPDLLQRIVLRDGRYLIPRRDGLILAGSTLEEVGFDKETTSAGYEELRQAAFNILPSLADYPIVNHWAGLRPGSPQGVPWIGECSEIRGLYLNTGHYRNGVAMGPGSARLLADCLLGCTSFTGLDAYRVPVT
jgi:glycine oxidase